MTTTGWASPRDEFPDSVRALMSLWGGFANPSESSDSGLDKRLELDFEQPIAISTLPLAELLDVMAVLDQQLTHHSIDGEVLAATFSHCLLFLTARRLIVTCSSPVLLHTIVEPLLELLTAHDVSVEWASFFRKNTTSPWTTCSATSDIMAAEYADLKAVFPTGQSFLLGPVDGDHYSHFVYDGINRQTLSRKEDDVQVNVFLYDIERAEALAAADDDKHKGQQESQQLKVLPHEEYEMLRVLADVPHASFETNSAAAAHSADRVEKLLADFNPSHFTIVALQDKDTDPAPLRKAFQSFPGYIVRNRAVNHFGEGYAFHQIAFVRQE